MKGVQMNSFLKKGENLLKHVPKKGFKMTKLHFYSGSGASSMSGIKACIFGATAGISNKIAYQLFASGTPTVLCHRNPMDVLSPVGDDPLYARSNPYHTLKEFVLNFDTHKSVRL